MNVICDTHAPSNEWEDSLQPNGANKNSTYLSTANSTNTVYTHPTTEHWSDVTLTNMCIKPRQDKHCIALHCIAFMSTINIAMER